MSVSGLSMPQTRALLTMVAVQFSRRVRAATKAAQAAADKAERRARA